MRYQFLTVMTVTALTMAAAVAEEDKGTISEGDKEPIKSAMQFAHKAPKGEKKLSQKIIEGNATDEELKKALRFYRGMVDSKPPKGDPAEFKARVIKLVTALEGVVEKKPKSMALYKEAVNCKACHSEHKGD